MRNHLAIAQVYVHAYKARGTKIIKKTAHTVTEEITSQNMKELGIATAALSGIYLTARVYASKADDTSAISE